MEILKDNVIIHLADCLNVLRSMPENSVDSVVTDPPYGLSFMGKRWDYDVPSVEIWKECLRVLKPGGHMLAFAGTRTQHRMAVRIEDAGFEIRDMIAWVYGCLSFDTEVLTERGFRRLHKLTQYDRIAVYDIEKNIYKWERPQKWNIYQVNEDTAYRIKSDYTDQIVSRNHRCVVEREGKLIFVQAEELNEVEYMPTLSGDFLTLQKGYWKLLLSDLLWKSKGLAQKVFSKWIGKEVSSKRIKDGKKPSLERWSNLFSQARKLQADKICAVSEAVFADGKKRRLCDGTSFDFSKLNRALPIENGSGASSQSQPAGQPTGKPDVIRIKQGTQITRRARIEKITYSGIIFCPTVSTGAFVARRNGQVFITGNSGFPKSLNIGKAIDKAAGAEREIIGKRDTFTGSNKDSNTFMASPRLMDITAPATDAAKRWEGWGTALKPSFESVTVATKPLDISGYCAILIANLTERIESCRQSASNAEKSSRPSQADSQGEKTSTVQENAAIHTGEAPANGTETGQADDTNSEADMSASMSAAESFALNTLLSWRRTLEGVSDAAKMSTTTTAFETITDWKILSFCLSQITPADIIAARFNPSGLSADALRAVEYLNASLACCANTLALSVLAPVMSQEAEACRGVGAQPNLDPCIMARKPFNTTVAKNVQAFGTGALNIDGCRVETSDSLNGGAYSKERKPSTSEWNAHGGTIHNSTGKEYIQPTGRWPANLILSYNEDEFELRPGVTAEQKKSLLKFLYENT